MTPIATREAGRAVIVGSGVAGLSTALSVGDCTVVTRRFGGGSTAHAQGGIAAAVGPDDDPHHHRNDTVAVAAGLADPEVVESITAEGPRAVALLQAHGASFDRELGREAGHSHRRIVHARGDATGAEVSATLMRAVRDRSDIEVIDDTVVIDLLVGGDGGVGGLVMRTGDGELVAITAPATILCTGGIGGLFARTTNPPGVRGDGLAMAARVGATLRDLEFVQFHPTALDVAADPLPLLTEALRGEGAVLIDAVGRRFMPAHHPAAELAPRDVVAAAVFERARSGPVYLDATRAIGDAFPERFPTVFASAQAHGIDPRCDPMPVSAAAHYHMGGIATDLDGRTSVPGLWAAGEVASIGLHGANRLASNSLLEGLVVGRRVGTAIRREGATIPTHLHVPETALTLSGDEDPRIVAAVRHIMWRDVGVIRDGEGLERALGELDQLPADSSGGLDARTVAILVTTAALRRHESRGGHRRRDHPRPLDGAALHSTITPDPALAVELDTVVRTAA